MITFQRMTSVPRHLSVSSTMTPDVHLIGEVSPNAIEPVRQYLLLERVPTGVNQLWAYKVNGSIELGAIVPMSPDERYDHLFGAIRSLALDVDLLDDGEGVDEATAQDASTVLALIENYNVSPPAIFSHSGRAVVFSWDLPRVSRYLTVSSGKVSVLDIDRNTRIRCKYPASLIEGDKIGGYLRALGRENAASHSV